MHEPCHIYSGSGNPEREITACAGAFYLDASTGTIYHKSKGGDSTGWVAVSWNGSVSSATSQGPEVPRGVIDGINKDFTLANVPSPESSVWGFWNNAAVFQPGDFVVNGAIVTMTVAPHGGQNPDVVRFFYRY